MLARIMLPWLLCLHWVLWKRLLKNSNCSTTRAIFVSVGNLDLYQGKVVLSCFTKGAVSSQIASKIGDCSFNICSERATVRVTLVFLIIILFECNLTTGTYGFESQQGLVYGYFVPRYFPSTNKKAILLLIAEWKNESINQISVWCEITWHTWNEMTRYWLSTRNSFCKYRIGLTDFFVAVVSLFVIRHFFAISTNPGEQFFTFTSLAAWLLTCCGRNFEQPQEVCIFLRDGRIGRHGL